MTVSDMGLFHSMKGDTYKLYIYIYIYIYEIKCATHTPIYIWEREKS